MKLELWSQNEQGEEFASRNRLYNHDEARENWGTTGPGVHPNVAIKPPLIAWDREFSFFDPKKRLMFLMLKFSGYPLNLSMI